MAFKLSCGLVPFPALLGFQISLLGFTFERALNIFQLSMCTYVFIHTRVCLCRNGLEEIYLFAFFGENNYNDSVCQGIPQLLLISVTGDR